MQRYLIMGIFLIANISAICGQTDANNILITNAEYVKIFLDGEKVEYDEIWIPRQIDILKHKAVLKEYLQNADPNAPKDSNLVDTKFILENINEYTIEYSGFIKDGKKFLICQFVLFKLKRDLNSFSFIMDGGCGVVRIVIEFENKKIIKIRCNGEA